MIRRSLQVLATAVALTLLNFALAWVLPVQSRPTADTGVVIGIANALVAGILVLIGVHTPATGRRLATLLFAVWASIQANYLVEAVAFDLAVSASDGVRLYLNAIVVSLVAGVLVAALLSREHEPQASPVAPPIPSLRLVRGLLLCGIAYVILYIAAGSLLAWPIVRSFYEGRPVPAPGPLFALQIVRGAAFALTVLLVERNTSFRSPAGDLAAGLTLSVLGGLAPLLAPSGYLPDLVRLAHLPEVVVSNFAFAIVARRVLLSQTRAVHVPVREAAR